MELGKIVHLHYLAKTLHYGIVIPYDLSFTLNGVTYKLHCIMKMLESAKEKVIKEMGGLGSLDKEVEKRLKYGFRRVEFLNNEIRAPRFSRSDSEVYLSKLAKDVLEDVPLFTDPVNQGRSLVRELEIMIDRKKEIEELARILLSDDSNNFGPISVIPVLGMAGTGKTSLIRLIYYKQRVQAHFDKVDWVDINGVRSNIQIDQFIRQLYSSRSMSYSVNELLLELESELEYKKYLLVLEDLSDDQNFGKWIELLVSLLCVFAKCKPGSKILVTSRSTSVEPHILVQLRMSKVAPYLLKPLHLNEYIAYFESIAFRGIAEEDRNPRMIEIGHEIFYKCADNLHAITIIASILSSKPANQEKWNYFNNILLRRFEHTIEEFQLVVDLMLKHDSHTEFLSYLTLFPLDYNFRKSELQQLWEALGFLFADPSLKEFNDCFEKLLVVGYISENNKRDKNGAPVCYNIAKTFLLEVVKYLSSDDYCLLDKSTMEVDAQHVSFVVDSSWEAPSWLYGAKVLKSLLFLPSNSCRFVSIPNFNDILSQLKSLQALDVSVVACTSCADPIWELKQLRYLRLGISFGSLPEHITNLQYLTTLDLRHSTIQELPNSFHKLSCLRHLYTGGRLIDLPPSFGELTQLQTLDVFVVGRNNGLGALANLVHLVGKLKINYKSYYENMSPAYDIISANKNPKILTDMKLDDLSLVWSSSNRESAAEIECENDFMEFEFLQPPSTLRSLAVQSWKGARFPQWVTDWFSLPNNLVLIHIADCHRCQHLPSFRSLYRLESLQLWGLDALEWIEIYEDISKPRPSATEYFPSLKYLIMVNLPQLKGWSKVQDHDDADFHQHNDKKEHHVSQKTIFNCLSELRVSGCPKLMSLPQVPSLETLEVANIQEKLLKHLLSSQKSPTSASLASPTLKELYINSVYDLVSISITTTSLQVLTITDCRNLINVFIESSNSLKQLKIVSCCRLKNISGAMHSLSALEKLEIESCEELDWTDLMEYGEKSGDDSVAAALQGLNNLQSFSVTNSYKPEPLSRGLSLSCLITLKELSLCWLYNMVILPESIGHLTQLSRLVIQYCPKLKKLPKCLSSLKSLTKLEIKGCPKLEKRCKQPNGEDCNLTDHIPNIHIG